jgi:2-methylcitrate dehydratase PrpD
VRRTDGSTQVGEVASSRGGPDNPLDERQLMEKFRLNAGPGHEALAQTALRLESLSSVEELSSLLAAPVEAAL